MIQVLRQLPSRRRPFTLKSDSVRSGAIRSDAVRSDADESDGARTESGHRRLRGSGLWCGVRLFTAMAVLLVVCTAYGASAYAAAPTRTWRSPSP